MGLVLKVDVARRSSRALERRRPCILSVSAAVEPPPRAGFRLGGLGACAPLTMSSRPAPRRLSLSAAVEPLGIGAITLPRLEQVLSLPDGGSVAALRSGSMLAGAGKKTRLRPGRQSGDPSAGCSGPLREPARRQSAGSGPCPLRSSGWLASASGSDRPASTSTWAQHPHTRSRVALALDPPRSRPEVIVTTCRPRRSSPAEVASDRAVSVCGPREVANHDLRLASGPLDRRV